MAYLNGKEIMFSPHIHIDAGFDAGFEEGKAYAYDNPQTPTDGRDNLIAWYAYLNFALDYIWDDYYDEETWEIIIPRWDESTWLESLEYPKGTSHVTAFNRAMTTFIWDDLYLTYDILSIPTKKFTGTLDMSAAQSVSYVYGYDAHVQDAGTVILPLSPDCQYTQFMFRRMYNLVTIRLVGTIQWDLGFNESSLLDGDTIRHIVGLLSDTTTGKTLTLNSIAVSDAMPWDEWEELADTKRNWTISLV